MNDWKETPLESPAKKKKMVLLVCLLYVALEMKIKIKEVG